jgi:hypothetical protein
MRIGKAVAPRCVSGVGAAAKLSDARVTPSDPYLRDRQGANPRSPIECSQLGGAATPAPAS